MDDDTRTPQTEPADPATGHTTGTGWSTPQQGTGASAPWRTQPDTGAIPRPSDTRTIPGYAPPSGTDGAATTAAPANGKRGIGVLVAVALGAGLAGGAAGAGIVAATQDDSGAPPVTSLDEPSATEAADLPVDMSGVAAVADTVTPSVVSIGIEGPTGSGGGSGVIISSDGQILTNSHVARAAGENGSLTVTFHDGTTAEAEIVGQDQQTDIAVLQAEDVSGLPPATLGNSDSLTVGSDVIAFGSPLGLDGTVTRGIVSALHRPVQAGPQGGPQEEEPTLFEAIQTDASINPGNSGGPLVNTEGEVVGINTAIATRPGIDGSIGLGFAIPINSARFIAEQIIDTGEVHYARIGISVGNGDGTDPAATVAGVQDGGAADEAGIEAGDVITHIDGRFMSDAAALVAAARSFQPGDEVEITYVRDGEESTVEITMGSSVDDEPQE